MIGQYNGRTRPSDSGEVFQNDFALRSQTLTGQKLPAVYSSLYQALPTDLMELSEMTGREARGRKGLGFHGLCYLALFKLGPGSFRKAYKGYVKQATATGDFEAARRKHLMPLAGARAAALDIVARKLKLAK